MSVAHVNVPWANVCLNCERDEHIHVAAAVLLLHACGADPEGEVAGFGARWR